MTWPSRPANNDDTASYQHVHVYKRYLCLALQSASTSLNDPLMSDLGAIYRQSEATRHGTGQLLNLSDGSGAVDARPLDSELQRRWHVGLGWWGTGQCNWSSQALYSLRGKLYPHQLAVTR